MPLVINFVSFVNFVCTNLDGKKEQGCKVSTSSIGKSLNKHLALEPAFINVLGKV